MEYNGCLRQSHRKALQVFAASSMFGLVLWALPSKIVLANQPSVSSDTPLTQSDADRQIASLLTKIEQALLDNEAAPSEDIVKMLVSALELLPGSSTEGRRLMTAFPTRLTERAAEERAAGRQEKAVYLSAFADASKILAQPDMEQAGSDRAQNSMSAVPVPDQENAAGTRQPEEPKQAAVPENSTHESEQADAETSAALASGDGTSRDTATKDSQLAQQSQESPLPSDEAGTTRDDIRAREPDVIAAPLSPAAAPTADQGQADRPASDVAGASVADPVQTPMAAPVVAYATPQAADMPKAQIAPPLPTLSPSIQQNLLTRGESMLGLGDLVAARMLFAHAASSGVGIAALKVGDTYNPAVLAALNLRGIKADAGAAEAWYRKAQALGEPLADERLEKLQAHR